MGCKPSKKAQTPGGYDFSFCIDRSPKTPMGPSMRKKDKEARNNGDDYDDEGSGYSSGDEDDAPQATDEKKPGLVETLVAGAKKTWNELNNDVPYRRLQPDLARCTDLRFLSWIRLCAAMARVAYQDANLSRRAIEVDVAPPGQAPEMVRGEMLKVNLQEGNPDEPPQWTVIYVASRHVIFVAFRGTATKKDAMVDSEYYTRELNGPEQFARDLRMHCGVSRNLDMVFAEVEVAIQNALHQFPGSLVVFTGHSLGGGYAHAAFIRSMPLGMQLETERGGQVAMRVVTFGAPLVVALPTNRGTPQEQETLGTMDAHMLDGATSRAVHVVNRYDLVPRLLGPHSHTDALYEMSGWARDKFGKSTEAIEAAAHYRPIGRFYGILDTPEKKTVVLQATDHATRAALLRARTGPWAVKNYGGDHKMEVSYMQRLTQSTALVDAERNGGAEGNQQHSAQPPADR